MKYCNECGKKISDKALTCPKCGAPMSTTTTKSKAISVVMAVFLAQWTWVYTYKKDAWKFWLGMGLCFFGIFMLLIPNIGVWIWSIIDTAVKNKEWYNNYLGK